MLMNLLQALILFISVFYIKCEINLIQPPTRDPLLWNLGQTTTTRKPGAAPLKDEVLVSTNLGKIIGRRVWLHDLPWTPQQDRSEQITHNMYYPEPNPMPWKNNIEVFVFKGVPYAEPPIGNRRFKSPQRLISFPGQSPFIAENDPRICMQDVEMEPRPEIRKQSPWNADEDCLYLNIYTPTVSQAAKQHYPVMVFLHGGNYQTGNINEWPGHVLASRGIVVVNVQYRLGAFGFMGLGDPDTGNYGLQDQREALRWVQDNIANFGGDPQAVTLAGHDAGGVCAQLQMLDPQSQRLFRSVMSFSGGDVSYWQTIGKPALMFNNTMKLGHYLGCIEKQAHNVWDCIATKGSQEIIWATNNIPIEYNRYLFMPSVNGKDVSAHPLWSLQNAPTGNSPIPPQVPLFISQNLQDGTEILASKRRIGEYQQYNSIDYQMMRGDTLEYVFRHNYTMNKEAICDAIIDRYRYWPDPSDDWMMREKYINLFTDAYYTAPIAESAHLHSALGRTWMLVNAYNFSRGYEELRFVPDWMGVCRECDLYLMFGYAWAPPELRPYFMEDAVFTDEDKNASIIYSNIIRRFVTFQDPNFQSDGSWAAHEPRRHWYMEFNYTRSHSLDVPGVLKRDFRYQSSAFWNQYIPALVNYMTTTFPPSVVSERQALIYTYWIIGVLVIIVMILAVASFGMGYKLFEVTLPMAEHENRALVEYTDTFPSRASVVSPKTTTNYGRVERMSAI